jgi:hypothetical protein
MEAHQQSAHQEFILNIIEAICLLLSDEPACLATAQLWVQLVHTPKN